MTSNSSMPAAPNQSFFHWWIMLPWNVWLDSANKLMQILAIVASALASVIVFFRFGVRMELDISGRTFTRHGSRYLMATARLKNTGAVKRTISQKGTGLQISILSETSASAAISVSWRPVAVLTVFEPHTWIDPSEVFEEPILASLPAGHAAVKLELRVLSKGSRLFRKALAWNATTIVGLVEDEKEAGAIRWNPPNNE